MSGSGVRALARLGSEDACAALTRMLKTPCTDERARTYGDIIRALADKDYSAAEPIMTTLLDDRRETSAGGRLICSWAMYALAKFDPEGPGYWSFMGNFPRDDPRGSRGVDLMREAWKTYLEIKEKGGPAKAEPESVARLAEALLQLAEIRQESRYSGPAQSIAWVVKAQELIPLAPAEQQKALTLKAKTLREELTRKKDRGTTRPQ